MQSNVQADVEYLLNIVIFFGTSFVNRHLRSSIVSPVSNSESILITVGHTFITTLNPLSISVGCNKSKNSYGALIPIL